MTDTTVPETVHPADVVPDAETHLLHVEQLVEQIKKGSPFDVILAKVVSGAKQLAGKLLPENPASTPTAPSTAGTSSSEHVSE